MIVLMWPTDLRQIRLPVCQSQTVLLTDKQNYNYTLFPYIASACFFGSLPQEAMIFKHTYLFSDHIILCSAQPNVDIQHVGQIGAEYSNALHFMANNIETQKAVTVTRGKATSACSRQEYFFLTYNLYMYLYTYIFKHSNENWAKIVRWYSLI